MLFGIPAQKLARYLSYVIATIFVLLPFHEFLVVWIGSNTGHLDALRIWKEVLICLTLVPALVLALKNPKLKKWLFSSWIVRLYVLYIVLHLVLGLWALDTHRVNRVALIYALIVNLRFIGFFILCALVAAHDNFLKKYWQKLVLIPAGIVIAFGLLQRFILPYDFLKHFGYGPKTIPAYETVDNNLAYRRIQSTLRGANPFGAYLVVIMTASVARLRGKNANPIYLLAAILAMFFTYSRSAWLGVFLSLGFLAWLGKKHIGSRWMYAGLAAIVGLAAGFYIFRGHQSIQDTLLHTSKNSQSSITSNGARSSAIKGALSDVFHQPLGEGPGTAGPASFRNTGHPARIAENYYLQLGQEVGILGMVIFLIINGLVAWQLWLKKDEGLARILLASLIGITIINLLSHAWTDDTLSLLWWGLAGVAIAPSVAIIKPDKRKQNASQKT